MGTYRRSASSHTPDTKSHSDSGQSRRGRRRSSRQLFDPKEGLRALDAAEDVLALGPLRYGLDGQFWAFQGGVWVPGDDELHARIVRTLGNQYRPAHSNTIRDVIRAHVGRIDCEPVEKYINFRNGLLDWRTGELVPHDPDIPCTVQLAVDWKPNAQCQLFRDFLAQVIPADDAARVWELLGYMLLSGNPLHKVFLLAGGGRNGKGAFMRTLLALLGNENVSSVPLADFSSNRFSTAQLFGKHANLCGDIDATYMEQTGRFKEATGQDAIQAEHKFGRPFRFTAWASMLFSCNEIPGSADSSKGWVDRWEVIPFPNYIGDRKDQTLEPRLQAAGSLEGIAAAAVPALRVLMDRGAFRTTGSGEAAKEEFARKSNPLIRWLEDRAQLDPEAWEPQTRMYLDYQAWTGDEGVKPLARARFYEKVRQLADRGLTPARRTGTDGFRGVRLVRG